MIDPEDAMPTDPSAALRWPPSLVGYTTGVFDAIDPGQLRLLREARRHCDHLIVGVAGDELAPAGTVFPLAERMAVVAAIRFVDRVVPQRTIDQLHAWATLHYDVLFLDDQLRESPCAQQAEAELADLGVRVEYLPGLGRLPVE